MPNPLENYFQTLPEPQKSTLNALRTIILKYHSDLSETRKYGMPCYIFQKKAFCYLWTDKNTKEPYILLVEGGQIHHSSLIQGTRKRMKTLIIDPKKDIPIDLIYEIFDLILPLYEK